MDSRGHNYYLIMFYYIYSLSTAPGVMIHELSHALFCVLSGVKIKKIRLFQFGRIAGYVEHEEPTKFYQSVLVSFGPLIINSLLSLVCFARLIPPFNNWQPWALLWLGLAIGLHAIPSTGDAKTLLMVTNQRVKRNPLIIIGYPFVLFLYLLNFLRRLHLDIVYVALLFWLGRFYLKG